MTNEIKVWVLEKWINREAMLESLKTMEELYVEQSAAEGCNEELVKQIKMTLDSSRKREQENPDGYWSFWEGKTIYSQFIERAHEGIKRAKHGDKFRVVEATMDSRAKYISKYEVVTVNEKVLKYLYATSK